MSNKFTGITSAGSAIPVYDKDAHSALSQKLDIAVYSAASGNFLTAVPDEYAKTSAVEDMVSAASADLNTAIGNKLDTSSFADVSGSFLTEVPESAVSGFATHEEVESATSGKMNIADMTAYQTVEDMSAYQPSGDYQAAGDYYSASNPSGFITGVDLTPYQTIEGMSAYQPVGDYYSASNPSGFIDANALTPYQTIEGMSAYQPSGDYLPASESANYYPMEGNPSGFLTEHQSLAGYMQTSGLEYDGDKISGYMGSAFAGGGEVPEGVMVESAVGFNAVNEISGYNGSAIAQYGAEKQWLVHDDTLVHASNSAQYALGVNVSAVQMLMNVSEVSACMKIVNNTVTGNAGSMNRVVSKVSADIPDGWNFMCWCSFHTNGWVGAVDAGQPLASATDIWGIYAASNYSNTANCKINCVYLIKKKLPGEE
jgi:hypothetical protein